MSWVSHLADDLGGLDVSDSIRAQALDYHGNRCGRCDSIDGLRVACDPRDRGAVEAGWVYLDRLTVICSACTDHRLVAEPRIGW